MGAPGCYVIVVFLDRGNRSIGLAFFVVVVGELRIVRVYLFCCVRERTSERCCEF